MLPDQDVFEVRGMVEHESVTIRGLYRVDIFTFTLPHFGAANETFYLGLNGGGSYRGLTI